MKHVPALFTCLFLLLLMAACNNNWQTGEEINPDSKSLPPYTVVKIEGCEYFRFYSTHGYVHITHKGNCSNPIHAYAKVTGK